jgi:penicillin-binding protein 1A
MAYKKRVASWKSQKSVKKRPSFWRILAYIAIVLLSLIIVGLGLFVYYLYTLPIPQDLTFSFSESSSILDRNGQLIATYSPAEKRIYKPLAEISPYLQKAVIAVEDHRFYEHSGIDIQGILRSLWDDLVYGQIVEGASTITQQLAREAFLTKEVSLSRKLKEIMIAFRLEQKYSKDEILESYLNAVYFGQNAYGAEAAALTYFGKHAKDLNLAEAAWLAGVINAPSVLGSPEHRDLASERQKEVLSKMKLYRFIDEGEYDQALNTQIVFSESAIKLESEAPYFVDLVRSELEQKYSTNILLKGGLTIYTTLDLQMQRWANEAVDETYKYWEDQGVLDPELRDEKGVKQPQGALVAIDPRTGDILAMVGGRDWYETKFNRALAPRQPGSSFKIFDYTAAIENRIVTPATVLVSEEIDVNGWKPTEYTGDVDPGAKRFYGPLTVRDAIRVSSNVIATKVSLQVGLDKVIEYAHKMGVTVDIPPYPSIAIGTAEIPPLEMAQAYGVLANYGKLVPATVIRKIVDREGNVLEDNPPVPKQVISPATAYVMTDLFKTVYRNTRRAYVEGLIAAGKTGTTDRFQDAWFIGYTPDIVVAVCNGNDSRDIPFITKYNIGAGIPASMWHAFMEKAKSVLSGQDWIMPQGVVRKNGEVFLAGTENMATSTPTVVVTQTPSWITQTPSWLLPPPSPTSTPTFSFTPVPTPTSSPTPVLPSPSPTFTPSLFPPPSPSPPPPIQTSAPPQ